MYSSVQAERCAGDPMKLEGHAYDVSEGGIRIELDEPLAIGEQLRIVIDLPFAGRAVRGEGKVVWINDACDDPGPRRMALAFTGFESSEDRDRLASCLRSGLQRAAA